MEVFVLQHQTRFRAYNVGVYSNLELAKTALDKELKQTISEPPEEVRTKYKTPENTQPWHWKNVVVAVELNQFTWEAGDVPDWFVIEKHSLAGAD